MNKAPALTEIRPLTRTSSSTGNTYRRETSVEEQILEAMRLEPGALVERASLRDTQDRLYLKEETLVYAIREYQVQGQERIVSDLAEILIDRSLPHIRGKLRTLGVDRAEEAEDDVVEMLFARLLDLNSDRGDFFQVRYWAFLNRLLADAFRRQLGQMRKVKDDVAPDWVHGSEPADDAEPGAHYVPPAASGGLTAEERLLLGEALAALEEPYRTLVVLRYYDGWPVESNDPADITISGYFSKTPRTIRNWLNTADERLRAWREGKR